MLTAFVEDTANLSRAMGRVATAVAQYAPSDVRITEDRADADLILMHVVGFNETEEEVRNIRARNKRYAMLQYCLRTTQKPRANDWCYSVWSGAEAVWSYYDLPQMLVDDGVFEGRLMGNFYDAPLGVDAPFTDAFEEKPRDICVMTSGYVSAPGGEAIEEAAIAAEASQGRVVHLGPEHVVGMTHQPGPLWSAINGIPDSTLAARYRRSRWVSGLRHIEGFELPAVEGLMCGARPIVFDRPDMRRWYDGHAVFVPECSGGELIEMLIPILASVPPPVTAEERDVIRERFNWAPIVQGFWEKVV